MRALARGRAQTGRTKFLAASSSDTARRYPTLAGLGEEITAIDDAGGVYRGTEAYLVCLYALKRWRAWSFRLSSPAWRPLTKRAFELLSKKRGSLSKLVGSGPLEDPCSGACAAKPGTHGRLSTIRAKTRERLEST